MPEVNSPSSVTGAAVAVLVMLSFGLFGTTGWLAAMVLGVIAGVVMGLLMHWLTGQGGQSADASEWEPSVTELRPLAEAPHLAEPEAPAAMPGTGPADDLRAIRGVGVKVEAALHAAGITRYAQIAAWDEARIDEMGARIGRAASRIRGDDWVGQARVLADQPPGEA